MKVIHTIEELRTVLLAHRTQGEKIGFVPTMGALHQGHISLMKAAKKDNEIVVVSIFVNPTQFGVGEDFDTYPRTLEKDSELAATAGVDYIFAPRVEEMYPPNAQTFVEVTDITQFLCGKSRPTHFRGVTTVVLKLLNIVQPDKAYFGQKDAQQVAVLQRMVKDLFIPVEIIPCPIHREEDGLAMSSRNIYLSTDERKAALVLHQSLVLAKELIEAGETNASIIYHKIEEMINSQPYGTIDYIEIVSFDTLEGIAVLQGKILIALAVKFGKARLIDNILLEV